MSNVITFAPTTAAGEAEFVVPFPFLSRDHVKLYVNGVEDTAKEWVSDGSFRASVAIPTGAICVVKRETPRSALITTLPTTGTLSSDDMNEQSLQAVYVATEAADGLREGLALDEATETYWEGAPAGTNRTLKDVVDPALAQDAATKVYYDTKLTTEAAAAAASVINAASSEGNAAIDAATATSQAAAATTSAANAALSETAAAASDALLDGIELWADNAEEWAIKAEDSLISTGDSGGNGVDDYSAYHHGQKASASAASASASNDTAQAVAAAATPYLSSILLGDELGVAYNWAGGNVSVTGEDTPASHPRIYNMTMQEFGDTYHTAWYAADNEYNNFDRSGYFADYGTPQTHFYPSIGHKGTTYEGLRVGYSCNRACAQFLGLPSNPGSSTYYGSTTNCTDASTTAVQKLFQRGCTKITMTASGGGLNYNTNDQIGRSGTLVTAGRKTYVTMAIQYGDWDNFKVEVDFVSNSTNYKSGTINLNAGGTPTWSLGDFTDGFMLEGPLGWWIWVFEVPAQVSDSSHTTDFVRLYFTDSGGGLTPSAGGDGTSHVYAGYLNLAYTPTTTCAPNGTINSGNSAAINMETARLGGGGFDNVWGMQNWDTLQEEGATFWTTLFINTPEYHYQTGENGEAAEIVGCQDLTHHIAVRFNGPNEELELYINDNTLATPSSHTIASFTPEPMDNDGMGTKIQLVLTFKDDVYYVYYKINNGAKQTFTVTEVTNTTWLSQDANNFYPGFYNDAGRQLSGTLRFSGYFKRYISATEADRYLNWG